MALRRSNVERERDSRRRLSLPSFTPRPQRARGAASPPPPPPSRVGAATRRGKECMRLTIHFRARSPPLRPLSPFSPSPSPRSRASSDHRLPLLARDRPGGPAAPPRHVRESPGTRARAPPRVVSNNVDTTSAPDCTPRASAPPSLALLRCAPPARSSRAVRPVRQVDPSFAAACWERKGRAPGRLLPPLRALDSRAPGGGSHDGALT